MKLVEILDSLANESIEQAAVKRAVRRVRTIDKKGFRKRSPNDADQVVFLALLAWVTGDTQGAVQLLEYLDSTIDPSADRMDIKASLGEARLFLAQIAFESGDLQRCNMFMSKEYIDHTGDLESSENPAKSWIERELKDLEWAENDSRSTASDVVLDAYNGFWATTIVIRRFEEIADRTNEVDKAALENANKHFRQRLIQYIPLTKWPQS